MDSRERVFRGLERTQPDRLPIFQQLLPDGWPGFPPTVVATPSGVTFRIVWLPVSATYTFPALSTVWVFQDDPSYSAYLRSSLASS